MTDFLTSPQGFGADDSPRASYTLRVNGVERPVADAWIGESLLYVLRERLGLAGAKGGCEQGECGACSVQVDGQLTAACLVPAALAVGVEVRTVEGLAEEGVPSDVQQALAESGAVQCGYCAPGLAMAVHDLLERNHHPSELESRQALCGNLCRCTGYRGALAAVQAVAAARADVEESSDDDVAPTPFFGDGVIEAAAPAEELVPAQAEHVDPYDYDALDGADAIADDGYDVDAELPVYVDVPPQHGGYEGYETPGYPQQESYPQQGYATGTYDQPYQQPHEPSSGEGPYPGGPFGGRFPTQSDAAGEAVGPQDPGGTEYHPDYGTGPYPTGGFHAGEYATGQFDTGQFAGDRFATGQFPVVDQAGAGADYARQEYATGEYPMPSVPEQGGQAGQAEALTQTGELRLGAGLGSGLGAGMRAQAAARRLAEAPASTAATATATATTATAPASFGGAATSAAGLPTEVTGSFHVGTLSVAPDPTGPFHVGTLADHGGVGPGVPADLPYDGATGVPGGLDPATGVYVLPHQHGQESGS